jgi:hypothetical protein
MTGIWQPVESSEGYALTTRNKEIARGAAVAYQLVIIDTMDRNVSSSPKFTMDISW